MNRVQEEMSELESAEAFFEYLDVAFDADVVRVYRLHILQRFHEYIAQEGAMPQGEAELRLWYGTLLARAYADFVQSTPQQEKVFAVFRNSARDTVEVSLSTPQTRFDR